MEFSSLMDVVVSLITLTFLEVVLGVDNLVFITLITNRLPLAQQKIAKQVGLTLVLMTRLLLLASVVWLIKLTQPLFTIYAHAISIRDLLFIAGGLFLLIKATLEIHTEFEAINSTTVKAYAKFIAVISQIAILDIVFSLDSIFTAVGLTQRYWIMACAIFIAIMLMIVASEPLSRIINRYPTIKMLALSFLLLIGMMLIADGFKFHVPREYVYFAVGFSVFVEVMNNLIRRRKGKN